MSGINKVILVGHIGKEPELKTLTDDVLMLCFPLATTEVTRQGGIKTEQTEWHNIIMWRALAEAAAKVLTKGTLVYLEGKARTHSFEKDGTKKYTTEIIIDHFTILGRRGDFVEEIALGSKYSSNPKMPYSLPIPDCLKPPKGALESCERPLMQILPASSWEATR